MAPPKSNSGLWTTINISGTSKLTIKTTNGTLPDKYQLAIHSALTPGSFTVMSPLIVVSAPGESEADFLGAGGDVGRLGFYRILFEPYGKLSLPLIYNWTRSIPRL